MCFRCCNKIIILHVGCAFLVLCGLLFSAFLLVWTCRVAGIFSIAGWDVGSVVLSPRRGFCVGRLSVDICVVSNIAVNCCHMRCVKNECVLTCLSDRRCWRGAVA
jgi:hypothetical protein